MKRFLLALEIFFQRQVSDDDDSDLRDILDRMARDIKGSLFALLAIFQLISLVSYLPIDSVSIAHGRLDNINNLGGIVGAMFAEWFLGSVGITGYAIVGITLFAAYLAFQGLSLRDNFFRLVGAVLGSLLFAVACNLLGKEHFPDWSLFQGGNVGKQAGAWLLHYFNLSGALLIVAGGFVITIILTTGASIIGFVRPLFDDRDDEAFDEEEDEEDRAPKRKKKKKVAKKKPAKKKKKAKADSDEEEDEFLLEQDEEAQEELDGEDADGEEEEDEDEEKEPGFEELIPFTGKVNLPSGRLLKAHSNGAKKPSRGEQKKISQQLNDHLLSFNITGKFSHVSIGPVLTTYEYKPSAGVKLKAIANLQDDLGVVLGTNKLRIQAPIPGKTVVGIEVPRPLPEVISLKELVTKNEFYEKKLKLPVPLGKSTDGKPVVGDLAAMPHLLVAGSTGSGKSVFVNCLITGFLYRLTPQQVRMILIDPKMLELNAFAGIPHLISDVITNNQHAVHALDWCVEEMERRYGLMAQHGSKNIESYNSKVRGNNKLPYIVVVVDELADLMMTAGEVVEVSITRLAQKARAAGIHLVIATQRPSTDVITGIIKANIPSRLSFKVPSGIDSRTVLDTGGAQDLIGRGDSLMIRPATPLQRIHGCFVSEDELKRVVNYVRGKKKHDYLYLDFSTPVKEPPPTKKKRRKRG